MIIISILLQNCVPVKKDSGEYEKWTSTDPLSVNYKTRKQMFDNQNLVYNSSFEFGKVKQLDSLTSSLKVDGWKLIGQSVEWVNSGKDSVLENPDIVHNGLHSIHIQRRHADETENTGQGVLSDYIKVIPGNYLLSLFMNLKDISNPKSRLGTKIYDAVNIRVLYYDKNKIQLSQKKYSEYYKTNIDNSFKGLSFANFEEIDSTGWIHVIGRSHIFPFQDGDLQDDAKYVRIFVGLKGTGDMWIDDIDFRYTKWNLTTFERLSPYFDTVLSKSQLIVPQPVEINILQSVIYYRPFYKESFPVILVPEIPDKITTLAAESFEKRIKEYLISMAGLDSSEIPGLIKKGSLSEKDDASVVFSIGRNSQFNKYRKLLPLEKIKDKEDGFFIHSPEDLSNTVFLFGNSANANFYAVQAALQLFDKKSLLYHNANVVDYPFRNDRSLLITELNDNLFNFFSISTHTRFNHVYLPAESDKIMQIVSAEYGTEMYTKCLYFNLAGESYNSTDEISFLNSKIKKYQADIEGVALFVNSPLHGVINVENAMSLSGSSSIISADYNLKSLNTIFNSFDIPTEFMPCYSGKLSILPNSSFRDQFTGINDYKASKKTSCIWTGYGFQSWRIDEADLLFFEMECDYPIIFMDFTMYPRDRNMGYFAYDSLYPYKLLTSSLFEPFENEIVPEVYNRVDNVILAYNVSNIFDRIRLQTASDFMWNPSNYNADLSLFKALLNEFGAETSLGLLEFNDLYFKIKSELIIARDPAANTKHHVKKASGLLNQIQILQKKLILSEHSESGAELNNLLRSLIHELELIKINIVQTYTVN